MRTAEAVRAPKNPSRATPFVGFFSATFWPAANLRFALWAGQNVIYSRDVRYFRISLCSKEIRNHRSKIGHYPHIPACYLPPFMVLLVGIF
jgi:hypothetical protein